MTDFIKPTNLKGLFRIERPTNADNRGFFREVFHLDEVKEMTGVDFNPVQMNHSLSKPRVIRALHAENWNKLIYPLTGQMIAVIVDIRPDSETFGKYQIFEFKDDNRFALFIPIGFANSICVTGESDVNYLYLVDKYYTGDDTKAIAWDDPDLAIEWPIKGPIISERDKNNPTMRQMFPEKYR